MSPVDNVGHKSTCPSKLSCPRPLAEPMFEVYDSGSWSCSNCNSEFSKLESIGRHLYTCLNLLRSRSPASKNSDKAGKAVKKLTVSTRPVSPSYRCSICSKVFKRKYHLEVHSRIHTGVKPYQCGLCARKFTQQSALNRHKNNRCKCLKLNSKPRSGKYTTSSKRTYPKVFKNKTALTPSSLIHSGHKPYSCSLCSSTFKYPTSLRIHQLCHRNLRQFVCPICTTGFNSHGNLRKHTPKHSHGIPPDSTDVKCTRCSTIFFTQAALIQHVKTHPRYKKFKNSIERPKYKAGVITTAASRNSNGSFARSRRMKPNATTTTDSVKCGICSKSFNSQSTLRRHMIVHGGGVKVKQKTDVEIHSCKICSKVLSDKPSLARHARMHSGVKPYKCNLCTAKFLYPQGLRYHKFTHSNQKPFACTICKVGFNNSSNWHRHNRSFHVPVTPTKLKLNATSIPIPTLKSIPSEKPSMSSSTTCSVCSKVFTRKTRLSRHMRLDTGEKPYECSMCEAKFADHSSLRNHQYIHSSPQFVCDICQTSFIHPASLRQHVPKHTHAIPAKSIGSVRCIRCGKLFSSNLSLITHMEQHSGK